MLSLDIDGDKIRVVTGKSRRNTVSVSDYFEVGLPEGQSLLSDGAPQAFGGILRDVLQTRGVRDKRAVVPLRGPDMFVHRVSLPKARPPRIAEMVSHSLSSFPAVRDYYIDYMIERERVEAGNKMLDVLLCGVPKNLAAACYGLVVAAGLLPHRMDFRQNCIHKLLGEQARINGQSLRDEAVLLLDAGSSLLGCDLLVDGKSVFERTVPTRQQAGPLDFSSDMDGFGFRPFDDARSDSINPLYARMRDEAQRMMQFSLSRAFKLPVSRILLFGVNAEDKELGAYLADSLGVPASPISEATGLALEPGYTGPGVSGVFGGAAALL